LVGALSLVTWNLGYAGLGADADFRMDGGESILPSSRQRVAENLSAIIEYLSTRTSDLILLQEVAGPSLLTRGVDVNAALAALFHNWQVAFVPGTTSRSPLGALNVKVGNFSATSIDKAMISALDLPGHDTFALGLLHRRYRAVVVRLPPGTVGPREWVIFNVHLSAFDPDAQLRRLQLRVIVDEAERHYRAGRQVVIGGDWNMRLAPTSFPHRTEDRYLSWLADLPPEEIPQGWQVAVDPATATVRTLHLPYIAGRNYTTIIDGFICSPNVEVVSITGQNLGFSHSDHNPVCLVVTPR